VPANIAEGYGRRHKRDRLHFLNIAEASLAEMSYCVHVAGRLDYFGPELVSELENNLSGVGAPLVGLIRSIQSPDDQ
jgi:four helix bundle protein